MVIHILMQIHLVKKTGHLNINLEFNKVIMVFSSTTRVVAVLMLHLQWSIVLIPLCFLGTYMYQQMHM